jgi:hypothetical protein
MSGLFPTSNLLPNSPFSKGGYRGITEVSPNFITPPRLGDKEVEKRCSPPKADAGGLGVSPNFQLPPRLGDKGG